MHLIYVIYIYMIYIYIYIYICGIYICVCDIYMLYIYICIYVIYTCDIFICMIYIDIYVYVRYIYNIIYIWYIYIYISCIYLYIWYIYIYTYVIYVFHCGQLPCFRAYPDMHNACAFIINHNFWIMSWWLMVDGLQTFFPKQCGHTGGSYGSYKGRVFIRGGLMHAQHLWWNLQHKRALVKDVHLHFDCTGSHKPSVAETSRTILSSLCARQIVLIVVRCEFLDRSRSTRRFVRVGPLSLWHGANLGIPRATLSALWACQIARYGPVLVLRSLAQPSRHFGRVRSLSLWRGADFDNQGNLAQRSLQGGLL